MNCVLLCLQENRPTHLLKRKSETKGKSETKERRISPSISFISGAGFNTQSHQESAFALDNSAFLSSWFNYGWFGLLQWYWINFMEAGVKFSSKTLRSKNKREYNNEGRLIVVANVSSPWLHVLYVQIGCVDDWTIPHVTENHAFHWFDSLSHWLYDYFLLGTNDVQIYNGLFGFVLLGLPV